VLLATAAPASAATAPSLGTAESFAVLGGQTVTNTGPTTIVGDIGVSPGSAIADSGAITLTGATHVADGVALQAQSDTTTAYNVLAGEPCTASFTGTAVELGSQTLIPGVYCYSSSAQLTGALTLNGPGVYIFKTGSTLTTAVGSSVSLIGGAEACNVFWQIGSSADLFGGTSFVGNVLALTSINMQSGASILGRALAQNGAVTLDTNTITSTSCAAGITPTATATTVPGATATSSPAPGATPTAPPAGTTPTGSVTPNPLTPTAPGVTATPPLGAPPASPIQPPASSAPPLVPRLPETGSAEPQGGGSPWLLAVLAAFVGSITLGSGAATYTNRARRRLVRVLAETQSNIR
jgi:type VI secretion system secreted protein VgrG